MLPPPYLRHRTSCCTRHISPCRCPPSSPAMICTCLSAAKHCWMSIFQASLCGKLLLHVVTGSHLHLAKLLRAGLRDLTRTEAGQINARDFSIWNIYWSILKIRLLLLNVIKWGKKSMTFPKLLGWIYFSKTFPGLENDIFKFHDFSGFFQTVRTLNLCENQGLIETKDCLSSKLKQKA